MKVTTKNLRDRFRCGDCLHFKVQANLKKDQVCSNLGIRAAQLAPNCFTPDVTQIVRNSDHLLMLAHLFHGYTAKQRRILLSFLQQDSKKYKFGTKVYFLAVGKDYLSNYLSGYVVGLDSNKHIIVTGDPDKNKRGKGYTATFISEDSLLTSEQFEVKKQELFDKDRLIDPSSPLQEIKKVIQIDYEPPTLDKFNSYAPKPEAKKRKKDKVKIV